jgi:hypothetical protein
MMCPETRSIGAYLLGALDPQEQVELEWHLAGCENCRQELIDVAPLPGLMHRLTLDDVSRMATGYDLQAEAVPDVVPGSNVARPSFGASSVEASFWSALVRGVIQSRMLLPAMSGGVRAERRCRDSGLVVDQLRGALDGSGQYIDSAVAGELGPAALRRRPDQRCRQPQLDSVEEGPITRAQPLLPVAQLTALADSKAWGLPPVGYGKDLGR